MTKSRISQGKIDAMIARRAAYAAMLQQLAEALDDPRGIEVGLTTRIATLDSRIQEIDFCLDLILPKGVEDAESDADGGVQREVPGNDGGNAGHLQTPEQAL